MHWFAVPGEVHIYAWITADMPDTVCSQAMLCETAQCIEMIWEAHFTVE